MAGVADPLSFSSAIDLSRLPPPTVVETLSYETILARKVARLQETLPEFDATVDSDPAVKILQLGAYDEMLLRQEFNDRVRQVMLAYATGANLDQLGALVNVARLLIDEGDPENGIDPVYESDADFRARIQLAPEAFSVAGPESAYIFHALRAHPSIADASASSPEPGQVLVSILSRLGTGAATDAQIEAVEDILTAAAVRPLTDQVTVASAEIVNYEVEAGLTLFDGPDATVVLARSQAQVATYQERSRRLGRNITRAGLFAAAWAEGVSNVDLVKPAADIVIAPHQCANNVGTSITVVGRGG